MGILTGILMFIFFSIVAACDGDWSGIEVIIKFVAGFALFALVLYLMTQPVLILVCIHYCFSRFNYGTMISPNYLKP